MPNTRKFQGRVLTIAGSDSSGGAGLQADIKTISALGGYAMSAVTALTAQNTMGITGIKEVGADFVIEQARACIDDIGVDAIKIGMLPSADHISKVAALLRELDAEIPVVVDPVMRASTGRALGHEDGFDIFARELFPVTTVQTPNALEAAELSGLEVTCVEEMEAAGRVLRERGVEAVLVTGGHVDGDEITDVLVTKERTKTFVAPRLQSTNTHGTGCTLASAIATGLAFGLLLEEASRGAIEFVHGSIRNAQGLGNGNGPLNHQWKQSVD